MQDLDNQQTQSHTDEPSNLEMSDENLKELQDNASQEGQLQTFLKLKEHGQSSRTRALRLKENDIVVMCLSGRGDKDMETISKHV